MTLPNIECYNNNTIIIPTTVIRSMEHLDSFGTFSCCLMCIAHYTTLVISSSSSYIIWIYYCVSRPLYVYDVK